VSSHAHFAMFRHALVVAECLMSSTYNPSACGSRKNAARYRRIANAAWARGLTDSAAV
jgi:hypothetical protein